GVTRIEGDVIGDGSRYDDEFSVPSWENVSEYNAAHYDALMVDDGQFGPGTYGIVPSRSAARSFLNLLTDQGIEVDGSSGNATAPAGLATLAEVDSAPLSEVVNDLLLTSDNMTAELVLKEIGYVTAGEGTRQAGIETVSDQLEQWGVDLSDLVIEDGSGLSRENRITCEALVTVLGASPVPLGPFMPVANQSGTLTREFVDSPVAGRLQAKTGTLNEVKALSGVVDDARFSLLLNGEGANTAEVYRPVWDAVAIAADEWSFEVAIDPEGLGPRPTEDR
ncbi:MAG: D-alanyl-D-alanine carboxypeptidase/D-alanyl-D-alanine-endopeptidase, partial [Ilumatobacter coccineus]